MRPAIRSRTKTPPTNLGNYYSAGNDQQKPNRKRNQQLFMYEHSSPGKNIYLLQTQDLKQKLNKNEGSEIDRDAEMTLVNVQNLMSVPTASKKK